MSEEEVPQDPFFGSIVVDDADGRLLQYSFDGRPTPPPGCTTHDLTEAQADLFRAAIGQPNGGIVFNGSGFDLRPVPPPPIPAVASAGSFMRACVRLDWYDKIVAFVEAMPGMQGKELQALLKHAVEYRRYNEDLAAVAYAIGMTDGDIDDVFILADQIDKEEA